MAREARAEGGFERMAWYTPRGMFHLISASNRAFIPFLTLRYMIRRPLAIISILLLSFSVSVLVVVPSVMNGFQEDFHTRIRGSMSDLRLWCEQPFAIQRDPGFEKKLAAVEGVVAVAPYIENPALDKHLNKIDYCFIQGIDPRAEEKVSDIAKYLMSDYEVLKELNGFATADPQTQKMILDNIREAKQTVDKERIWRKLEEGSEDEPGVPSVIVPIYFLLAYDYDIMRDQNKDLGSIRLTTATDSAEVKQDKRFRVVGVYRSGAYQADRRALYMSLKTAQDFVGANGRVSGYSIKLDDFSRAAEVKKKVRALAVEAAQDGVIARSFSLKTWEERDVTLLAAVARERQLIRIITGIIVFAASATVLLVMIMSVLTKVRELGILRAVGASRFGVFLLFLGQGVLIALIAMILGCAFGIFVSIHLNEVADIVYKVTGQHPFPPEIYYLEKIPSKLVPREIAEDFGVTLVFAMIWGVIPAFIAAMRPPIRAIRYE